MQKPILIQFWDFLKKPSFLTTNSEDQESKNFYILQIISFCLASAILLQIFVFSFVGLFGFSIEDKNQVFTNLGGDYPLVTLFFASILFPFFEEVAFRFGLVKNRLWMLLGLSLAIYYFLISSTGLIFAWFLGTDTNSVLSSVFNIFLFATMAVSYLFFEKLDTTKTNTFLEKNFSKIFYTLSFLFAFIHLANFENIVNYWYLFPFLILPQFWVGLIFGFLRQKFGFWSALIAHGVHNLVLFWPLFLTAMVFNEKTYSKYTQIFSRVFSLDKLNFLQLAGFNIGLTFLIFVLGLVFVLGILATYESWKFYHKHIQVAQNAEKLF